MSFAPVRQLTLLIALLFGFTAGAVTLEPLSIQTLAAQADLVVQGKVRSKTSQRDPSGRIYTRVELDILEVWKGTVQGSPFSVVHSGGVLGERQSSIGAQVEYEIGEEVVAFLVRNQNGEAVTLGLAQGKFRVWENAATGARYAANPFHGMPQNRGAAIARAGTQAQRPQADQQLLSLADLKKQVREVLP